MQTLHLDLGYNIILRYENNYIENFTLDFISYMTYNVCRGDFIVQHRFLR